MRINNKKSMCMRIGPNYDKPCASITTLDGQTFGWVKSCRYLGVHLKSFRNLKCSFDNSKTKFRAFNCLVKLV
jgi:hypothetical protein